ncbi:carbohydrate ABC transporter permease [Thermoflexus sp.]|uniref:carbohydrate ABC transporter permease n=1 Tax=Thermoflexus sp. TaxID=1969742 RepID=UPI0025E113BC|nr:carbohydrate ABC transporter permease [Thermoflexus sp.]MDW8180275.1 carbohydrate ABC transporter permease [Anaerolineae bacterium]MCS6963639.1 carbohydrate ABC transporter permease [Thermoflexus sp.]MCS7350824.1 carbohydrate ABC transporter permease [Thermoflexus sp.]MCX7690362.1 carbohydrate ABC transporter permease [Thermoflexus sp.]MDW8185008.1 carbohydrate ABC transporter permease [Anaerolineae bacterium]
MAGEAIAIPAAVPARRKLSLWRVLSQSMAYVVLIAGFTFTLLPFVYVFLSSFKTNAELRRVPPTFIPESPTLENYVTVISDRQLALHRIFYNSGIVALSRTVLTLLISSFAGYIFARYRFTGRNLFFGMILAQLMIPFQVVMIPLYLLTVKMGLIDTLWALIIPLLIDAYGIFVAKQFVENFPSEILEAARLDGASEFGIYWRIIMPQLGPALASLGILTFMASWNDYLWPLIVITSPEKRTIPLALVWYSTQHGANQGLVLAAAMLTLLPIFIVYFIAQRWIVEQASQSAFK